MCSNNRCVRIYRSHLTPIAYFWVMTTVESITFLFKGGACIDDWNRFRQDTANIYITGTNGVLFLNRQIEYGYTKKYKSNMFYIYPMMYSLVSQGREYIWATMRGKWYRMIQLFWRLQVCNRKCLCRPLWTKFQKCTGLFTETWSTIVHWNPENYFVVFIVSVLGYTQ